MSERTVVSDDEEGLAQDSVSVHRACPTEEGRIARTLSNQDSPLLRLPGELRNWIYAHVLPDEEDAALIEPCFGWFYAEPYEEYCSIFQVCHALRAESEGLYFSSKHIHLVYICNYESETPRLLHNRLLERVGNLSAHAVSCIRNITIDITLDEDPSWEDMDDQITTQYQLTIDCQKANADLTVVEENWCGRQVGGWNGLEGREYWEQDLLGWMEEFNHSSVHGPREKRLRKAELERLVFCMFHEEWYYLSRIDVW